MALAEIAGRIHGVTDAIRDARIARMKEDHKREVKALAAGAAPLLATLAPDDFFKAQGLALAGGLLTPLLVDELAARVQGNRLGAREVALLLLAPARPEGEQHVLLDRALGIALDFLAESRPEHAVSVLNTASQMGGAGDAVVPGGGGLPPFRCVARVELDGHIPVTQFGQSPVNPGPVKLRLGLDERIVDHRCWDVADERDLRLKAAGRITAVLGLRLVEVASPKQRSRRPST